MGFTTANLAAFYGCSFVLLALFMVLIIAILNDGRKCMENP